MGDSHPSENKVVVQFAPDDLKLTDVQTSKLKKIAGARYNPETEMIKMSSNSFQHSAQNKAYLSNLIDDLIAAAKDPKDTFEDIPLDTRHHTFKSKPKFPKEWLLTAERKRELEGIWQSAMLEDGKRTEAGTMISGQEKIDGYLMEKMVEEQKKQESAQMEEVRAAPVRGRPRPGQRLRR
jgi:small subunit ribosomal protein S35